MRTILSLIFGLLGIYLIMRNWIGFWLGYIKKKYVGSWVPLVAAVFLAIGCLLSPNNTVKKFFWVGFLIDWCSLPGILYTLWKIYQDKRK